MTLDRTTISDIVTTNEQMASSDCTLFRKRVLTSHREEHLQLRLHGCRRRRHTCRWVAIFPLGVLIFLLVLEVMSTAALVWEEGDWGCEC